eukprot:6320382-Amphidinium_carterae.1
MHTAIIGSSTQVRKTECAVMEYIHYMSGYTNFEYKNDIYFKESPDENKMNKQSWDYNPYEIFYIVYNNTQYQSTPASIVEPTVLDPINVSSTTVSTTTRCSDINMLAIPKQQPHKRKRPLVFEGNKQETS